MFSLMQRQLGGLAEVPTAQWTVEGPLAGVQVEVFPQIRLSSELLPALRTGNLLLFEVSDVYMTL